MMLGYANVGIPDKSWQPPVAVLETSMGTINVEMYWKHAPNTCRNFMELIRRGLVECDKNDCPVDDVRIVRAYIPK
ncbi:cyclophilin type peptidyl-prolyl cis-trans isomerase/CLD domain-containing protein [Phthorimaea operculella]|nr:cyclophilin type peptidyl-prolyl cis-trans isomerase/CLD domain-containing protein [Phthorimaea operculella]